MELNLAINLASLDSIIEESADVGNFAMFIHDIAIARKKGN